MSLTLKTIMNSYDAIDMDPDSVSTIYKHDNQDNLLTDTRIQDSKSIIKIGQGNSQIRAISPQTSGFYRYIILCLYNIFKQWHVIYFIVFTVAKSFYMCNFHPQSMIAQTVLILIYLVLEMVLRYRTFHSYVLTEQKLKENKFQIWSTEEDKWMQVNYSSLKPGHIIKVKSSSDNRNVMNPVNILPIYLPSKRSHFQLKTTKLNKFQQVKEIPLIQVFRKVNTEETSMRKIVHRLQNIRIFYEYTIENSDVFQGKIKVGQNEAFYISNKSILPQGVPVIGEEYIVGVVLINLSNINQKSLKRALNASNQTIYKLGKSLIPLAFVFTFIGGFAFLIEFLIIITSNYKKSSLSSQAITYLCIALNIVALLSHCIYIGMFIFLLIHRLRDSFILKHKNEIFIKNSIKSIDQFGQTNTIIMDDYFFIDKNLFEVQEMVYNLDSQMNFDQELIFNVIQKSQRLKEEMYDLWISAFRYFRYFRNRPRRYTKIKTQFKVNILKEKIFKQSVNYSSITLVVEIQSGTQQKKLDLSETSIASKRYIFRFTQKPRHTTIERIKDQKIKASVKALAKNKSLLHIMIEVLEVDSSSIDFQRQQYQLISRNLEPTKFQFLTLISSRINKTPYPLSLIKNEEIIKKQNLIILSSKKWKYLQLILHHNAIDTSHIISLQEKQFHTIKYDIDFHLKQLRQMNKVNEKHAILAIHCNLVSYLTRPELMRGLIKLGRYCKYIVFHDCSQYQKQVCCMNLFEIFPLHIYLSNYLCDIQLIEKSNLSVCEKGESTQPYVTLVVKTYKDLRFLILNQAVESINITVFIVKSFLFKNQILIMSMIITQFMVFQGRYFVLGVEYTGLLFLTYNLITALPVLYYVLFRPQIWQQPIYKNNDPNKLSRLQYITDRKVIVQFIRALFVSFVISLLNYSFLASTTIQNIYFSILTSCVVASGYHQLFIDDARKKTIQVITFFCLVITFYIYIYFLQLWNSAGFHLVQIQTNLTTKDTVYFYISNILIVPFVLGFVFYGMSALNAKIEPEKYQSLETISEGQSIQELPAKTAQQYGKELRFRDQ